jgi:hypothetical protein
MPPPREAKPEDHFHEHGPLPSLALRQASGGKSIVSHHRRDQADADRVNLRRFAAGLAILLAACSPVEEALRPAALPPKPTPGPTEKIRPTPFSPRLPTATGPPETPVPLSGSWPPPFTYGRWGEPAIPIPLPAAEITFPEDTLNVLLLGSDRRSGTGSAPIRS